MHIGAVILPEKTTSAGAKPFRSLLQVCAQIRMPRPQHLPKFIVIPGATVGIVNACLQLLSCEDCLTGFRLLNSSQKNHPIRLLSSRCRRICDSIAAFFPGCSSRHEIRQLLPVEFRTPRQALYNHADSVAVGFPVDFNPQVFSKFFFHNTLSVPFCPIKRYRVPFAAS